MSIKGQSLAPRKGEAEQLEIELERERLINRASRGGKHHEVFKGIDDELWLWANTAGYREYESLRKLLPALPSEAVQTRFTGCSGDVTVTRGVAAYKLFKELINKYLGNLSGLANILDFGCGWGRIVRLFLKDLDANRIWGVDCLPTIIEVCEQTNKWCNFRVVDPLPPTSFSDEMFDLIYSYSVFSHLSEVAHLKWLTEFERLLRPGGLLIATTRPRQFIEYCNSLSRASEARPPSISTAFSNMKQTLSDYDRGRYCHHPLGGGDTLDKSFFGETCIPKAYVKKHWTKEFAFLEYIESPNLQFQNTIVMRKRV